MCETCNKLSNEKWMESKNLLSDFKSLGVFIENLQLALCYYHIIIIIADEATATASFRYMNVEKSTIAVNGNGGF